MYLSLGQAAKETGKSKSVISSALKSGRLSGNRNDKGEWEIDPAELFRVFPRQNAEEPEKEQFRTPENPFQNALLEQEIKHLREQLDREQEINRDLTRRLDQEAEERRKLTLILTDQRAPAPSPAPTEPPPKIKQPPLARPWLLVLLIAVVLAGAFFFLKDPGFSFLQNP